MGYYWSLHMITTNAQILPSSLDCKLNSLHLHSQYKGIPFNCLGDLFMLNWIGGEMCSSTCDVNMRKGYWLFCGGV